MKTCQFSLGGNGKECRQHLVSGGISARFMHHSSLVYRTKNQMGGLSLNLSYCGLVSWHINIMRTKSQDWSYSPKWEFWTKWAQCWHWVRVSLLLYQLIGPQAYGGVVANQGRSYRD